MRKKKTTPLTPLEYAEKHDIAHIRALCERVGTSYSYWKRIRDRRQRPSVDLARKFVEHSGGELSLMGLLFARDEQRKTGAPPVRGLIRSMTGLSPAA